MLQFQLIRDVKAPERDASENSGIDLFIPNFNEEFFTDLVNKNMYNNVDIEDDGLYIYPQANILIPAGIKSKFPNCLSLVLFNKSGIATKHQLVVGAQVIDSGYQGEWHIHLINTSDKIVKLEYGQKITQAIPLVINTDELTITKDEIHTEKTNRGEGGFGSTGI